MQKTISTLELEEKSKNLENLVKFDLKKNYEWSDYYSSEKCLKEYSNFPNFLKLAAFTDHGPALEENLLPIYNQNKYRAHLLQNKLKINEYLKINKKAYCTGSPFVHFRRKKNISIKKGASGTICFPFHSTNYIKINYDINNYIDQLNSLPDKFKPVTICMHHCDIEDGKHNYYLNKGFNVVTAGHKFDEKFVDRFYEILSNNLYATSNGYGSHVPYCIEMGLPFFFTKNNVIIKNNGDKNYPKISYTEDESYQIKFRKASMYYTANKIFSKITSEINEEQKMFAEKVLGINDAVSPRKLNRILWIELIHHYNNMLKHSIKTTLLYIFRKR